LICSQIWLSPLADNYQSTYIGKLEKKRCFPRTPPPHGKW
jgi:hypothetical protein